MKKFVKEVNGEKVTIECDNENLFSLYEREGFEEEAEEKKAKK